MLSSTNYDYLYKVTCVFFVCILMSRPHCATAGLRYVIVTFAGNSNWLLVEFEMYFYSPFQMLT